MRDGYANPMSCHAPELLCKRFCAIYIPRNNRLDANEELGCKCNATGTGCRCGMGMAQGITPKNDPLPISDAGPEEKDARRCRPAGTAMRAIRRAAGSRMRRQDSFFIGRRAGWHEHVGLDA